MNWLVLAGVLITFATSLVGLAAGLASRRKIDEVHVLVNSQLQAVVDRVTQLTGALTDAGMDVPPDAGP